MLSKFALFLYVVTPDHPEMLESVKELKNILTGEIGKNFELEIVDVLRNPERAVQAGVMATPTLMRGVPPPPLRIVGDFTDKKKILAALALRPPFD